MHLIVSSSTRPLMLKAIHFHMIFLGGVYAGDSNGLTMWFR